MKTLRTSLAAITATALLAGLFAQASADEVQRPQSPITPDLVDGVSVADLDLSKPDDVRALYQRIRSSARALCEREHSALWDVKRVSHQQQCFRRAVDNAVSSADIAELALLHRGAEDRVAGR